MRNAVHNRSAVIFLFAVRFSASNEPVEFHFHGKLGCARCVCVGGGGGGQWEYTYHWSNDEIVLIFDFQMLVGMSLLCTLIF